MKNEQLKIWQNWCLAENYQHLVMLKDRLKYHKKVVADIQDIIKRTRKKIKEVKTNKNK